MTKTIEIKVVRVQHVTVPVIQNTFTKAIDAHSKLAASSQPIKTGCGDATLNESSLDLAAIGAIATKAIGVAALTVGGWMVLQNLTKRITA